ncbi:MAG: MotA/TolQ/ExbB proton channel family protein [Bacteroidetes bacterium]|nr:MotA/TolQ/ExbB proton channel family protein [Bacteroidota bacterium]
MKRKFDIGTVGGLTIGLLAIFGSFLLEGGEIGALILLPAMLIVFGGTFATAMIGTPLAIMKKFFTLIMITIRPPERDYRSIINSIVEFSMVARKEGLLVLEKHLSAVSDPFLLKLLRYTIDGIDIQVLRSIAETEAQYVSERHEKHISLFQRMGGYSPTMGIIGTVMGLIATLANAGEDPTKLIQHIATAFIATLWGVFMANLVWLPIADKLRSIDAEEQIFMDLVTEGIVGIQEGEIPSIIRSKLNSMLPKELQSIDGNEKKE